MPFAIAAVAAVASGAIAANSADKASDAQSGASKEAVAEQRRQYEQNRADATPYRIAGREAVYNLRSGLGLGRSLDDISNELRASHKFSYGLVPVATQGGLTEVVEKHDEDSLLKEAQRIYAQEQSQAGSLTRKFTLADFWNDPVTQASYQSGLDLGTQALDRMAGARGGRNSGQQLKALLRFGTDYTGQQAAGSQARFVGDQANVYNRLASLAGLGQTTVSQTGQLGQASAQNLGNILTAQGNARGAAAIAQGNAWQNTGNNISNAYMQQQYLNSYNRNNNQPSNSYYTGYVANGDYQYG